MANVEVVHDQLNYIGIFSKPAFELWGKGEKIYRGLFTALEPYGITLSNIHNNSASLDPSDQEVSVNIPGLLYRFKFDRIECTRTNASDEQLVTFPALLSSGDHWLRDDVPDFSFSSHLFTYLAHSKIPDSTPREVLSQLPSVEIKPLGVSRGCGLIYRSDLAEKHWELQLTVDHSLLVTDGIFVQFSILSKIDTQDYLLVLKEGRALFEESLATIGLEFND